jgi:hypothetical protein
VGFDFGLTEPEALKYLADLPNSRVKIPAATATLEAGLRPALRFHPKTYWFERVIQQTADFGLFSGSANLTYSGLHNGHETGMSSLHTSPLSEDEEAILASLHFWWKPAWDDAERCTSALIARYKAVRPSTIVVEDDTEVIQRFRQRKKKVITDDEGLCWASAKCFWIQTYKLYKNRGPDRSGNQVDCQRGTRVYFGFPPDEVPRNTVFGEVMIQCDGWSAVARSVRFGNNTMDKVNVPVPGEDGPDSYDDSWLHFERMGASRFLLKVGSAKDAEGWRKRSRDQGMYGTLRGDREFGFYS